MDDRGPGASEVTVAVLNYNGLRVLPSCLSSIKGLDSAPAEILVVDDGSTDGSPTWVREHHPGVRVIELGINSKRLNKVRNRALQAARCNVVLLVDNDVTIRADCLNELLRGLKTLPSAAVCMPRALYEHDPELIYQDGQELHYVGTTMAIHRNAPLRDASDAPRMSIGWGVQLIDKAKAAEVGFFNEDYVMGWGDDGEFNHKLNLIGYACYHIPTAVVFHKRVAGARRYYGSIRNRWRFILEMYHGRSLFLCAPALVLYEISLIFFLLAKGAIGSYIRAMWDVAGDLRSIMTVRRRVQARRGRRDAELMTCGRIFIAPEYVDSRILSTGFGALNHALDGYWRLIRRLL